VAVIVVVTPDGLSTQPGQPSRFRDIGERTGTIVAPEASPGKEILVAVVVIVAERHVTSHVERLDALVLEFMRLDDLVGLDLDPHEPDERLVVRTAERAHGGEALHQVSGDVADDASVSGIVTRERWGGRCQPDPCFTLLLEQHEELVVAQQVPVELAHGEDTPTGLVRDLHEVGLPNGEGVFAGVLVQARVVAAREAGGQAEPPRRIAPAASPVYTKMRVTRPG